MTERAGDNHRTLEQALTEAYHGQADPVLGDDLAHHVLREIRQQMSPNGRPSRAVWVEQLVWRTATVTAAVVLVMTVFAVGVVRTTTGEPGGGLADGLAAVPLLGDE